jgi:hypothetical protein
LLTAPTYQNPFDGKGKRIVKPGLFKLLVALCQKLEFAEKNFEHNLTTKTKDAYIFKRRESSSENLKKA